MDGSRISTTLCRDIINKRTTIWNSTRTTKQWLIIVKTPIPERENFFLKAYKEEYENAIWKEVTTRFPEYVL